MKENLHDIDKLFKDAIEQHSETPSGDVWNSIENKLDKSNVVSINKKYQRLKKIAAVLLLLLACAAVYEIADYKNHKGKSQIAGDNNKTKNIPGTTVVKTNPPGIIIEKKNPVSRNFDSSRSIKNQNDNAISGVDTSSGTNRNLHLKSSRSGITANAGDSLNQKNKEVTTVKEKEGISAKENTRANKNPAYKKANLSAVITNGDSGTNEEKINSSRNADEPLKRYFEPIGSSSYQNEFDRFFNEHVSAQNIILIAAQKPTPVNQNNIVKVPTAKNKIARPSRFSLDPFYSPDITFNTLQNDHPGGGPGGGRDDKHDIQKDEKHDHAFTWGLLAGYSLGNRLTLQSGVALSKSSTITRAKNIYAEKDAAGNVQYRVNASCGYGYILPKSNTNPAVGDSIKALDSKNTLQYLQVPLALKYSIPMGKFAFIPAAGIQMNFLTKGSIQTTTDNGTYKETQSVNTVEGLKKSYMSGIISTGIQYSIGKKIDLQFIPTGRFGFTSINNGATVKTFSNSIGLSAGIKIKL